MCSQTFPNKSQQIGIRPCYKQIKNVIHGIVKNFQSCAIFNATAQTEFILEICKSITQYTETLCTVKMQLLNQVGEKSFSPLRFETCVQFTTVECMIIPIIVSIRKQSKSFNSTNLSSTTLHAKFTSLLFCLWSRATANIYNPTEIWQDSWFKIVSYEFKVLTSNKSNEVSETIPAKLSVMWNQLLSLSIFSLFSEHYVSRKCVYRWWCFSSLFMMILHFKGLSS
jgi:hypothetical protein